MTVFLGIVGSAIGAALAIAVGLWVWAWKVNRQLTAAQHPSAGHR